MLPTSFWSTWIDKLITSYWMDIPVSNFAPFRNLLHYMLKQDPCAKTWGSWKVTCAKGGRGPRPHHFVGHSRENGSFRGKLEGPVEGEILEKSINNLHIKWKSINLLLFRMRKHPNLSPHNEIPWPFKMLKLLSFRGTYPWTPPGALRRAPGPHPWEASLYM